MVQDVISRSPDWRQHGHKYFEGDLYEKLLKTHIEIMENRMRLWLLKTLKRKNLTTRDIFFFSKKQGLLRKLNKLPDKKTILAAMHAKIVDLRKFLRRNIAMKRKIRQDIFKGTNREERKKLNIKLTELNNLVYEKKQVLRKKYLKKINHYEKTQVDIKATGQLDTITNIPAVPRGLEKYKDLSIFGGPRCIPKAVSTLGPFVCDKQIKLSNEELLILSKDPKFSLAFEPTETKFLTELERMASKQRYNTNQRNSKKKNSVVSSMRLDSIPERGIPDVNKFTKLNEVFRENQNRFIFNPIDNRINFNKRRATDYKLNKSVKLPRPMEANEEFECEMKKREFIQEFKAYQSIQTKRYEKKRKNNKKLERSGGSETNYSPKGWGGMKAPSKPPTPIDNLEDGKRGAPETDNSPMGWGGMKAPCQSPGRTKQQSGHSQSSRKVRQTPINLSTREQVGYKSLMKRVRDKELVITSTDKSSRFSIMSREQYLKAGYEHTKKDREISWDMVKYLQSQVNGHMWWLSNIVGYAHDTDKKRMNNNIQGTSMEVPEMVLLVKDHKEWDSSSDKPVPTRPVVSGSRGVNTHISEWLSEILEPIASHMKSAEVCSTEEVLSKIDKINSVIEAGVDTTKTNVLTEMSNTNKRQAPQLQVTVISQ